jgi:hypothetical protein
MAEEPIKRYPEPSGKDIALGAARAALSAIPYVGGSATELLGLVLAPPVARRRDEWLKELADALEELQKRVDGFSIESLQNNETFVSVTLQAAQAAMRTHQQEKRDALRNAALNSVLSQDTDEDEQLMFVGLTDVFTVLHLELLKLFGDRGNYPEIKRQQLRDRRELTDPIVLDLNNRGLLRDPRPSVARTRDSDESLTIQSWTLTRLGIKFLTFISLPKATQ